MAKKVIVEREADPVVHEHQNGGNNGLGMIVGIIVLIVVVFLALYYGLPYIRSAATPQVNIPSQIDVNVNK